MKKIIADNVEAFKLANFIDFFKIYNIIVGHSTTYYPQGNGLVES